MNSLLGAFILSFTAITAVTIGIFAAYAGVIGILHLFAHQRAQSPGRPMLVTQQAQAAHAGGD